MGPLRRKLFDVYQVTRATTARILVERRRGIETARRASLDEFGLAAPGRIGYAASPWLALHRALRSRGVRAEDVFLEVGCGKGRVLLQAAKRPFRRVVGVEIAPELVDVARKNLHREQPRRAAADIVCADILDYVVPDDVTVIYMYNPFRGDIFTAAMERFVASVDRIPRCVTLIYRSPFEHDAVMSTRRCTLIRRHRGVVPWSPASAIYVYELR